MGPNQLSAGYSVLAQCPLHVTQQQDDAAANAGQPGSLFVDTESV